MSSLGQEPTFKVLEDSCIQAMSMSSLGQECVYELLLLPETKIAKFANRVDLDEVAHDEPPHLDLHCLPSSL